MFKILTIYPCIKKISLNSKSANFIIRSVPKQLCSHYCKVFVLYDCSQSASIHRKMTANMDEYIKASAGEYKELFEKHEQYFKEITKKADENFNKLSEAIMNAKNEIDTCRKRNTEIRE